MELIVKGFCKNCGHTIFESDFIPEYPNIFECTNCNYPHTEEEIKKELQSYF